MAERDGGTEYFYEPPSATQEPDVEITVMDEIQFGQDDLTQEPLATPLTVEDYTTVDN